MDWNKISSKETFLYESLLRAFREYDRQHLAECHTKEHYHNHEGGLPGEQRQTGVNCEADPVTNKEWDKAYLAAYLDKISDPLGSNPYDLYGRTAVPPSEPKCECANIHDYLHDGCFTMQATNGDLVRILGRFCPVCGKPWPRRSRQ
jgi:hypothetical protein